MLSLRDTIAILKSRNNVPKIENRLNLQQKNQQVTKKTITPDRVESVLPEPVQTSYAEEQISDAKLEQISVSPLRVEHNDDGKHLVPVRVEQTPVCPAIVNHSQHDEAGTPFVTLRQFPVPDQLPLPLSSTGNQIPEPPAKVEQILAHGDQQRYPIPIEKISSVTGEQTISVTAEQTSYVIEEQTSFVTAEQTSYFIEEQTSFVTAEQTSSATVEEPFIPEASPVILNSFSLLHLGESEQERNEFDKLGKELNELLLKIHFPFTEAVMQAILNY
jgi:hypothetical protein